MDPLSIVGAVSDDSESVFSVSTLLYTFITSATVVDKSLEALQVEVKSLQVDGSGESLIMLYEILHERSPLSRGPYRSSV